MQFITKSVAPTTSTSLDDFEHATDGRGGDVAVSSWIVRCFTVSRGGMLSMVRGGQVN